VLFAACARTRAGFFPGWMAWRRHDAVCLAIVVSSAPIQRRIRGAQALLFHAAEAMASYTSPLRQQLTIKPDARRKIDPCVACPARWFLPPGPPSPGSRQKAARRGNPTHHGIERGWPVRQLSSGADTRGLARPARIGSGSGYWHRWRGRSLVCATGGAKTVGVIGRGT